LCRRTLSLSEAQGTNKQILLQKVSSVWRCSSFHCLSLACLAHRGGRAVVAYPLATFPLVLRYLVLSVCFRHHDATSRARMRLINRPSRPSNGNTLLLQTATYLAGPLDTLCDLESVVRRRPFLGNSLLFYTSFRRSFPHCRIDEYANTPYWWANISREPNHLRTRKDICGRHHTAVGLDSTASTTLVSDSRCNGSMRKGLRACKLFNTMAMARSVKARVFLGLHLHGIYCAIWLSCDRRQSQHLVKRAQVPSYVEETKWLPDPEGFVFDRTRTKGFGHKLLDHWTRIVAGAINTCRNGNIRDILA
jgi:hypothetical protein